MDIYIYRERGVQWRKTTIESEGRGYENGEQMRKNKNKVTDKKEIMFVKTGGWKKMKKKKEKEKRTETDGRSLLQNG